jgi:hypothetical protein
MHVQIFHEKLILFLAIKKKKITEIHGILKQNFMYKIYLIYVHVHHIFVYKIYFIYVFTYALGDINFAK